MYQKRVRTLRLYQEEQKEAKGNVLGEVRVNSHGTEHRFIARIANGNSQAAPQAYRTNAERDKEECEKCGVERKYVHSCFGVQRSVARGPAHTLRLASPSCQPFRANPAIRCSASPTLQRAHPWRRVSLINSIWIS